MRTRQLQKRNENMNKVKKLLKRVNSFQLVTRNVVIVNYVDA
jgi:hypothetical protein